MVPATSARTLLVLVGATALLVACTSDDAPSARGASSSVSPVDTSWFELAAVMAVHDRPCAPGQVPARDGARCYELDDALFDAAGVTAATAVEDEAPCPAGEAICVETGAGSTTTRSKPGTWSVQLTLSDAAVRSFNGLAAGCLQLAPRCPTGRVAMVLDGEVVTAAEVQDSSYRRDAFVLSGEFDRTDAERIAVRLSG